MESTEARYRFAEAAEHVFRLQEQLEAYKTALDHIAETSHSAGEVTAAAESLASALTGTADLLGEELLTQIEAVKHRLNAVQTQAERTEQALGSVSHDLAGSIHDSVTKQISTLQGTLDGVAAEYRQEFIGKLRQVRLLAASAVGLLSLLLALFLLRGCSSEPDTSSPGISLGEAQVQVLNGVGEGGLAGTFRDFLQSH